MRLVRALEPRYYTDPGIYRRELSTLFAETWQFAGHVSQLTDPGDYFTFEIAGESLFCVLNEDNDIRTFYNVCQHRAHQLVQGSGNANRIVCPYHSWTYELDVTNHEAELVDPELTDVTSIDFQPLRGNGQDYGNSVFRQATAGFYLVSVEGRTVGTPSAPVNSATLVEEQPAPGRQAGGGGGQIFPAAKPVKPKRATPTPQKARERT